MLTVAHLDHDPGNNAEENLAALCQRCHNGYDAHKRAANQIRRERKAAGQLELFEVGEVEG